MLTSNWFICYILDRTIIPYQNISIIWYDIDGGKDDGDYNEEAK